MLSDTIFRAAIIASLSIHGVVLFQNLHFRLHSAARNERLEKIEVTYTLNRTPPPPKQNPAPRELTVKLPTKITLEKKPLPPFVDKSTFFTQEGNRFSRERLDKPAFDKPDIISIKKNIALPPLDLNKINNSSYIGYYQIVREKIRRSAYQNFTHTETGEVYLSFIIASDGSLKDILIMDDKSSFSQYLRETSLRSVKSASPFPVFPKELDYPQLSFNVIISFEIE